MTDFFEPQLRYTRIPVDPEARRQAELEVKRKEAEQLRLSGARVVFNEETGTLRYEWNGNPLNLMNLASKHNEPKAPYSPDRGITMRYQRVPVDKTKQAAERQELLAELKTEAKKLQAANIPYTLDGERVQLRNEDMVYHSFMREAQ